MLLFHCVIKCYYFSCCYIMGCYEGLDREWLKENKHLLFPPVLPVWASKWRQQAALMPLHTSTLRFNHSPRRLQEHLTAADWSDQLSEGGGGVDPCAPVDRGWLFKMLGAKRRRGGWFASEQHGTEQIRFRQSEDIYIQRQLAPRLGKKRGGQLSSSTSIHYVSIKK